MHHYAFSRTRLQGNGLKAEALKKHSKSVVLGRCYLHYIYTYERLLARNVALTRPFLIGHPIETGIEIRVLVMVDNDKRCD